MGLSLQLGTLTMRLPRRSFSSPSSRPAYPIAITNDRERKPKIRKVSQKTANRTINPPSLSAPESLLWQKEIDPNRRWKVAVTNWIEQLKSPPNMITLSRIALTPFLSYWILTDQHILAGMGGFLAAGSDWLDGYLAKRFHMSTVLGTYLDPLADKILINTLAITLAAHAPTGDLLPWAWIGLGLTKDATLMAATYWHVSRHTPVGEVVLDPATVPWQVHPTGISKINTALQLLTLGTVWLCPMDLLPLLTEYSTEVVHGLCCVSGGTMLASAASYVNFSAFITSERSFPAGAPR